MAQLPLPVLEDYDVSPLTGFLPAEEPLALLPDPHFAPWEDIFRQMNGLLLASRIRQRVQELPVLDASRLKTKAEQRRAYLMMCMLSHAYVWGKHEPPAQSLPAQLAVPWQTVADLLEIQPILTHAAVVMWNWRLLYKDGPRDLNNIETISTLSGSSDESWFYLVTTAIEAAGAPVLPKLLHAMQLVRNDDMVALTQQLTEIKPIIDELVAVLRRMFERCDPYVFYWKVRPYLAGWENMAEAGLPDGVRYEGVDEGEFKRLAGGSAAQSSLIHALDIALGVEHHPTGFRPKAAAATAATAAVAALNPATASENSYNNPPEEAPADGGAKTPTPTESGTNISGSKSNNFLKKMRFYMPGPHRNFLEHLAKVANVRQYVVKHSTAEPIVSQRSPAVADLISIFDQCLHSVRTFRDVHLQIVTLYIIMQANRGPSISHGGFAQPATPKESVPTTIGSPVAHPTTGKDSLALSTSPTTTKEPKPSATSILYAQKIIFKPHGLAKKQEEGDVVRGTGGTDLMPFLKQARDETNESKIDIPPRRTSFSVNGIIASKPN